MSDMPPNPLPGHKMPHEDYLNASYGIRSWLLTTDHKRIALLYLGSVTFFFFLGGMKPGQDPHTAAPHHTPDFYIDESGFKLGVKAFCNLVFDYAAMKMESGKKKKGF